MKIAVCIKQVPVSNDVSVDPVTHALIRESSEGMINPADLNALEAAIVLKELTGGTVVVFTMGPDAAEKSLRTAMAMGCDEGCLVSDRLFAGGDTIATAKVLVESIRKFGQFDLILTGAMTSDGATGQVGAMIAQYMSIPHVAEIQAIDYKAADGEIEVIRKHHNQNVRLGVTLPALLTVSFGANIPRLTTLRSQRAAKNKPLTVYTNEALQMDENSAGLAGSPTVVIDSYEPEIKRKAEFLTGDARDLAGKMKALIEKEKGNS